MMRRTLSEHLRRYYSGQEIENERLDRLVRLIDMQAGQSEHAERRVRTARRRRLALRASGAAAVAAMAVIALLAFFDRPDGAEALAGAIGREIALNHNKNLLVEFPAGDYDELRSLMRKLDFAPRRPAFLEAGRLRVLGGRYCSIQGQIAAQIKLQDDRGEIVTLYETSFSDPFGELVQGERRVGDLRIRIWREGGLVLGLARSSLVEP